jgi:hypothetical protein
MFKEDFKWRPIYVFARISLNIFFAEENLPRKRCKENWNTHFVFNMFSRKSFGFQGN